MVVGIHGRQGFLRVRSQTDNPQRFTAGKVVYAQGLPYTIQQARTTLRGILLKLEDVDSDSQARALLRAELEVPEEDVPPAPEDTYYHFQLLEARVYAASGAYLGQVAEVLNTGSNDVYVVVDGDQELLVPALGDVVVEVDLETKRLTVDLPEGLEPRSLAPSPPARPKRPARRPRRRRPPVGTPGAPTERP